MGGQEQTLKLWPGREGGCGGGLGVSGAFLTSDSALQDWAWGWRVAAAGMVKPLASSRAASSVSCGQGEEVQCPAHGPSLPLLHRRLCGLSFSTHLPLSVACDD